MTNYIQLVILAVTSCRTYVKVNSKSKTAYVGGLGKPGHGRYDFKMTLVLAI